MRKIFVSLALIYCLVFMVGCNESQDDKTAKVYCDNVLIFLQNSDEENLKQLFCKEVQNSNDFEKEIKAVVDFFDGKIISHDRYSISEGDSWTDGECDQSHASPIIFNVLTDTDKIYIVSFFMYTEHKDESKIGITSLSITDENGDKKSAGYFIEY
ncbi:MAG: DUF5104 domain-containing protein [Ruminococcus sp.]|nr:DUF5104 domain-containing protein [Ruminococcus sp.]